MPVGHGIKTLFGLFVIIMTVHINILEMMGITYFDAKPYEPKMEPKKLSEIFKHLEDNGYRYSYCDGEHYWTKNDSPSFIGQMLVGVETKKLGLYDWHPEWLQEVKEDENN